MRTCAMLSLAAFAVVYLLNASTIHATQDENKKAKNDREALLHKALGWLPANTETLVVSNGPFMVAARDEDGGKKVSLARYLEDFSYGVLTTVSDGRYGKLLAGKEIVLAVEGARRFRHPKSLGMMPYDGCHILFFRDLGKAGDPLTKALAADAANVEKIGGHDVYVFEKKLEEDLWKFFFVQPKPNVLLCATDRAYLTETLERIAKGGKQRALPDNLSEWKHVDKAARFWAIRHYAYGKVRIEIAESPRVLDPKAVGFTFSFNPAKKPGDKETARMIYLSTNEDADKIATKAWTYFDQPKWRPVVRKSEPGVIEITAEFDRSQSAEYLFLLLFHLGHGIAV